MQCKVSVLAVRLHVRLVEPFVHVVDLLLKFVVDLWSDHVLLVGLRVAPPVRHDDDDHVPRNARPRLVLRVHVLDAGPDVLQDFVGGQVLGGGGLAHKDQQAQLRPPDAEDDGLVDERVGADVVFERQREEGLAGRQPDEVVAAADEFPAVRARRVGHEDVTGVERSGRVVVGVGDGAGGEAREDDAFVEVARFREGFHPNVVFGVWIWCHVVPVFVCGGVSERRVHQRACFAPEMGVTVSWIADVGVSLNLFLTLRSQSSA